MNMVLDHCLAIIIRIRICDLEDFWFSSFALFTHILKKNSSPFFYIEQWFLPETLLGNS